MNIKIILSGALAMLLSSCGDMPKDLEGGWGNDCKSPTIRLGYNAAEFRDLQFGASPMVPFEVTKQKFNGTDLRLTFLQRFPHDSQPSIPDQVEFLYHFVASTGYDTLTLVDVTITPSGNGTYNPQYFDHDHDHPNSGIGVPMKQCDHVPPPTR